MRLRRLLAIFLLLICSRLDAAPKVTFVESHMLGFWTFMQSISDGRRPSRVLQEAFLKSDYNTPSRTETLRELKQLHDVHFAHSYSFSDYPSSRDEMGWDVEQFFAVQSAKSHDLQEFASRTTQILPIAEHRRLFTLLADFLPVYDELIWQKSRKKLARYKEKIAAMADKANLSQQFDRAITFYNGNWPDTVPLTIYLHPIPAATGHTNATVVADAALVEVLLDEDDIAGRLGVVFHEICHAIYESQAADFQRQMETWFLSPTPKPSELESKYALFTYQTINEALATALGNGLMFKLLTGRDDNSAWYNNAEIEALARGIYAKTSDYFQAGRTLDREFVTDAVAIYRQQFPNAPFAYEKLFKEIFLATDDRLIAAKEASKVLRNAFRIPSVYSSSPISGKETLQTFREPNPQTTAIFVVNKHSLNELTAFEKLLPEMRAWRKQWQQSGNWLFTGFTKNQRAVLVFKIDKIETFSALVDKLRLKQTADRRQSLMQLN